MKPYSIIAAQREKALDKQLHSLIEQLAAKQVKLQLTCFLLSETYHFSTENFNDISSSFACVQAQAEGLVSEIHLKEMELDKLNGMRRRIESGSSDMKFSRNRFGRSSSFQESLSSEYSVDPRHKLPVHMGGRNESLQRLMLLRSAFVLYILALHILVFIKLSF